jgi:flagellin
MRINHNISALKANNQLGKTNSLLDKSLEKLSSGYRINSAADDSAGLAISEKMRTQISGLDQASRNASDGISVIQTAEGALVEVEAMLQRMRELAVQSANGTYTTEDRVAIQSEIDQLNEEITRISETTEFNTMTLLDGNIDRKSYSNNSNVNLVSLSDTVGIGNYGVKILQDARQAVVVGGVTEFTGPTTTAKISDTQAGSININGETVKVEAGDTIAQVFEKIRNVCDNVSINVFAVDAAASASNTDNLDMAGYTSKTLESGDRLVFTTKEYGSDQSVAIFCDNANLCGLLGLTSKGVKVEGYDAKAELEIKTADSNFENTATVSVKGNMVTVTDRNDFKMVFDVKPGTMGSVYTDSIIDDNPALEASKSLPPNTIEVGGQFVTITQDARQAVILGNRISGNPTDIVPAGDITVTVGATSFTITADGTTDTITSILAEIDAINGLVAEPVANDATPNSALPTAVAGYNTTTLATDTRILLVSDNYGTNTEISIKCNNDNIAAALGLSTVKVTTTGYDAKADLVYPKDNTTVTTDGNNVIVKEGVTTTTHLLTASEGPKTEFTDRTIIANNADATLSTVENHGIDVTVSVLDAGPMDLQIGANEGQIMSVRIPRVTPETLGVDKVNIGTAAGAQKAIAILDVAINTVSAIRSKLGAYQNRLEHSISNLDTTSENMTESLSRIEDVDMAEEMANYTQKNVLAQAGTSMLAQSNQRPQTILSLLQQ